MNSSDAATPTVHAESDLSAAAGPLCVYAIISADEDRIPPLQGLDPVYPVFLLDHAHLRAAVSRVRPDLYNQTAIEAGVQDPYWVETHVLAHQRVLDYLVSTGCSLIPMRFCTIYRDEAAVTAILAKHTVVLHEELERLRNKRELGVKLRVDATTLHAAIACGDPSLGEWAHDDAILALQARTAGTSPGGAFLFRKKLEAAIVERATGVAYAIADASHKFLADCAVAAVSNPPASHQSDCYLNSAYLVDVLRFDEFNAGLGRLAGQYGAAGFSYELSGPWPPYNFLRLDLGDEGPSP